MTAHVFVGVSGGAAKTELLDALIQEDAASPEIRDLSARLIAGTMTDEHVERLSRLHRFVSSCTYFREPIEMFHASWHTATTGADCDDHVRLLCALAWSLRYPYRIESVGDPDNPVHYSQELGYPPAQDPHGDAGTTWLAAETTIPAALGQHWSSAAR